MTRVPLAATVDPVRMPRILYGTAWKKTRTAPLVETAIRLGFRGIDTACQPRHYDEAGVGAGIAACLAAGAELGLRREDLYLQTKFTAVDGQDAANIPYDPRAALDEQVRQSAAQSLANLRTTYLDGLVLHAPLPTLEQTLEAWAAMEAVASTGVVRQLGISNCYRPAMLEALWRAARHKPTVVQNRLHADTGYDREIRAFCLEHGIVYQSFWTLTANPRILAHPKLARLASAHGVEAPQILFRCLTQIGVVPLTGTTSPAHMAADLAIFGFELRARDRDAVSVLLNGNVTARKS